MDAIAHIGTTATLTHAYLIRGGDATVQGVLEGLTARGIVTRGNPDCYAVSFESLGVDDVRTITDYASLAPLGERKYIIIEAKSATPEAQTALLKVVEEGTGRSAFFFIIEPGAFVLPTLASRCVTLSAKGGSASGGKSAEEFLKLSYKDRLAVAEKFTKDHDREGARNLVRSLLALAGQADAPRRNLGAKALRDLLDADRYLASSGSSPKSVIGHLALTL
jgi:hypothetical protein